MQLKLFLEPIDPTVPLWDQVDPKAKEEFLLALARVIAKAIPRDPNPKKKEDAHER
jgi:hypothetical protein